MNILKAVAQGQVESKRTLKPSQITLDPAMQQRVAIDEGVVKDYAKAWLAGEDLSLRDKMLVAYLTDMGVYVGIDVWHRHLGWVEAFDDKPREYTVVECTRREAILLSMKQNPGHGLRRTNADMRKAVETMLNDPEWQTWSNIEIAKACRVSDVFVGKVRREMGLQRDTVTAVRNGKEVTINTKNIGAATGNTNRAIEKVEQTPDKAATAGPEPVAEGAGAEGVEVVVAEHTRTIGAVKPVQPAPKNFVQVAPKVDLLRKGEKLPDDSTVFTEVEGETVFVVQADTVLVTSNGVVMTVDKALLVALVAEMTLAKLV